METLEASLNLAREVLAEELVPPQAQRDLARLAGHLAPIHCAGFEVRLADGDATVDLMQRVGVARGDPARLAEHIATTPLGEDETWGRLESFCREWSRPGSFFHRMVVVGFVGFDAAGTHDAAPAPSLYLSLEPGTGACPARLCELIAAASESLRGEPFSAATMDAVATCHQALPPGAAITDIGFMLARPMDALRVVVAHLPRADVSAYLDRLPWLESAPDVETALRHVPASVRNVIVSLDVGARVLPRVGLEYCAGHLDSDLPAWVEALDDLVDAGWCTRDKRDALLRWPGYIEPTQTPHPWPPTLLVESLLNRSDQFLVLARRLTFLKLVCEPGRVPRAKAYFGFGPRSFVTAGDESELTVAADESAAAPRLAPGQDAPRRDDAPLLEACADAIEKASGFLVAGRGDNGLWMDFPRVLRGGDEWVTGYVGAVLAGIDDDACRRAAHEGWEALCRRRDAANGWGHNADLPVDADSTQWGARLAAALGAQGEARAVAARHVLQGHLLANGGVATYEHGSRAALEELLCRTDIDGLFVAHTCVTAAAAHPTALGRKALPFLIETQEPDGRWRGYWWSDDEYTTWLAVYALLHSEESTAGPALQQARRWAADRFDRNHVVWSRGLAAPSPFATALCVAIVLATATDAHQESDGDRVHGALRWLLGTQRDDGSWAPAALMRMPPSNALDGDERPEATAVSADDRRLYTTSTVLRALSIALQLLR